MKEAVDLFREPHPPFLLPPPLSNNANCCSDFCTWSSFLAQDFTAFSLMLKPSKRS